MTLRTTGKAGKGWLWLTAGSQEGQVSKSLCRLKGCWHERNRSQLCLQVCDLSKDSTAVVGCRRKDLTLTYEDGAALRHPCVVGASGWGRVSELRRGLGYSSPCSSCQHRAGLGEFTKKVGEWEGPSAEHWDTAASTHSRAQMHPHTVGHRCIHSQARGPAGKLPSVAVPELCAQICCFRADV